MKNKFHVLLFLIVAICGVVIFIQINYSNERYDFYTQEKLKDNLRITDLEKKTNFNPQERMRYVWVDNAMVFQSPSLTAIEDWCLEFTQSVLFMEEGQEMSFGDETGVWVRIIAAHGKSLSVVWTLDSWLTKQLPVLVSNETLHAIYFHSLYDCDTDEENALEVWFFDNKQLYIDTWYGHGESIVEDVYWSVRGCSLNSQEQPRNEFFSFFETVEGRVAFMQKIRSTSFSCSYEADAGVLVIMNDDRYTGSWKCRPKGPMFWEGNFELINDQGVSVELTAVGL